MIPVLIGLGALVGGYLVVANWEEVTKWLQEFLPKIQDVLKSTGIADYAAKLFSSVENGALKLVHKLYYKENGKWIEKTTYSLHKLHPNSHLYTSDTAIPQFPGRMFQVETVIGFGKKELKSLLAGITKVNLTVRNFPASVAELRKRLHLTEGGDIYLFATTLYPEQKILIKCKR